MTLFDMIHFDRPYWLLFIPVTWVVFALIQYQHTASHALNQAIDKNLLVHLEHKGTQGKRNKWLGLLCFSLCWIGLAGISWTQSPATMFESTNKTILIVDQSMSMYATDIKPDRETQLKQTVRDILSESKDGDIALVAFAGDAYTISPFSQDKDTITHFLLALNPLVMPVYGSNLTSGIKTALSLINDKKALVHLIVLTDSLDANDKSAIPDLLKDYKVRVDLIAVGTKEGGEIQLPDGRVLKANGKHVIPATPIASLQALSQTINGRFYQGRLSPAELNTITGQSLPNKNAEQADNKSINWVDQGQWLAFPFLLWLAFQFRRGMLFVAVLGVFFLPSNKATASPLDWFKTSDQQGQQAVDNGDWQTAAKHFQRPDWKAASAYALGDYQQAANSLAAHSHSAADHYNLGNALALAGKTEKAIDAYKRALELDPAFKQAQDNLDYLKKQQKKQQQQKQNKKQQDNKKGQPPKNQQQNPSDKDQTPPSDHKNSPSKSKKDNKPAEKQDKKPSSEDNKESRDKEKSEQQKQSEAKLNNEQKQALNQWLRQIQDDPGTLLQRKLWYLHQEKRHENRFSQEDGQNPW